MRQWIAPMAAPRSQASSMITYPKFSQSTAYLQQSVCRQVPMCREPTWTSCLSACSDRMVTASRAGWEIWSSINSTATEISPMRMAQVQSTVKPALFPNARAVSGHQEKWIRILIGRTIRREPAFPQEPMRRYMKNQTRRTATLLKKVHRHMCCDQEALVRVSWKHAPRLSLRVMHWPISTVHPLRQPAWVQPIVQNAIYSLIG